MTSVSFWIYLMELRVGPSAAKLVSTRDVLGTWLRLLLAPNHSWSEVTIAVDFS